MLGANSRIKSGENCYNINQPERNKTMNNEQKKPVEAEELSEKELEGVVGGARAVLTRGDLTRADMNTRIVASVAVNEKRMDEVAVKCAAR